MPETKTIDRAKRDKRQGRSSSTQAGEFVREEMHHIREGKHGARSAKQAIAIGLSKARRAGVDLQPPKKGEASEKTRKNAERARRAGQEQPAHHASTRRSRSALHALKSEGSSAASHELLSRHGRAAARHRTAAERSAAAKKGAQTKGPAHRQRTAKKAARSRATRG